MTDRIRGFDGLRAIAVLLVFLHHRVTVPGGGVGQLGVWLFFALSGYLITGILMGQRRRIEVRGGGFGGELKTFLVRRTVRIFPVYYLLLVALSILVAIGALKREFAGGLPYHFAYLSNLWIAYVRQEWAGVFSHFWSLSIEEQFYLFFAPLLLAVPARRHWQVCLAVVAVGVVAVFGFKVAGAREILIYTHPLTNFWLLGLGGLGYCLCAPQGLGGRRALQHPLVLVALLSGVALFCANEVAWQASVDPMLSALVRVTYGVCVAGLVCWIAANGETGLIRWLETGWLAGIGRISYGFYLFHPFVPDLSKVERAKALFPGAVPAWASVLGVGVSLAGALAMAWLSWRLLEAPVLRLKAVLAPPEPPPAPRAA